MSAFADSGNLGERPVKFDDNVLKSLVGSNPRLNVQELSRSLGCIWSIVQRHLHELGKMHKQGI